jgi:hypothetical protein
VDFRLGRLTVDDPEFGRLEVEGDGFSAAGELPTLVTILAVQRQTGVTAEQSDRIARIIREYRDAVSVLFAQERSHPRSREAGMEQLRADTANRLEEVLGQPIANRLKRVSWRIRNADALFDRDLAAAIGLTPAQLEQLARIRRANTLEASAATREVNRARFKAPTAFAQRAAGAQGSGDERLLAILTPEQLDAFERLKRGERNPQQSD